MSNYNYDNNSYRPQSPISEKPPQQSFGKSIAGLVLGILAMVIFFIGFATFWSWLAGLVMAIIGLILSVAGYKSEGKNGKAIAGLVLSIIAMVLNMILFISCGLCTLAAISAVL
ncbi:MAG: hypothetical protein IAB16_03485 [Firmicutes bacterium]|uniref:DUF4190 domain-containing protein n=1 Tax=Candidatus Stercoripulliclostridium pullicola TaxID=2840953 RepID=A0A940ID08_9FIRM|nr:hypothetical protein [Candidatus Stercoripulliclostridium pullicola]